jgi:radical SAM superfamily enzyme YgiQ (UPF0313 family)
LDYNLLRLAGAVPGDHAFYGTALADILAAEPTAVAFTSMGVNTHVALLLAQEVKKGDPRCQVLVGGPHFSAMAADVLRLWPWIDHVFVGEAEEAFTECLREIAQQRRSPPRIWSHGPGQPSLAHPHGGYSHISVDDYFSVNSRRLLNYEGGRGCVFKCAFCYSPNHYLSARNHDNGKVVSDMFKLADLGAQHVFFVQDNLLNNPRNAIDLCERLSARGAPISWNAYATLPQLTPPLASKLAKAGCTGLYLGVDAVAETQRVSFNKRFYRGSDKLTGALKDLLDEGVIPTCAFIVDLFNLEPTDVELVFRVAADCAFVGAHIRINVLTPYPGTSLAHREGVRSYSEGKARITLDCPEVVRQNSLARTHPELFPFHATEISDEFEWQLRLRTVILAQRLLAVSPSAYRGGAGVQEALLWHGFKELARNPDFWQALPEQAFQPETF